MSSGMRTVNGDEVRRDRYKPAFAAVFSCSDVSPRRRRWRTLARAQSPLSPTSALCTRTRAPPPPTPHCPARPPSCVSRRTTRASSGRLLLHPAQHARPERARDVCLGAAVHPEDLALVVAPRRPAPPHHPHRRHGVRGHRPCACGLVGGPQSCNGRTTGRGHLASRVPRASLERRRRRCAPLRHGALHGAQGAGVPVGAAAAHERHVRQHHVAHALGPAHLPPRVHLAARTPPRKGAARHVP
jgi:hypothetical protein